MKKAAIGLAAFTLTAAAFFYFGPPAVGWFPASEEEEEQNAMPAGMVALETIGDLQIKQGESEAEALRVVNMTDMPVNYTLGHAQTHLDMEPESEQIAPGESKTVSFYVGDLFPPGSREVMVYLMAEAEGASFNMETYYISLDIVPGELELKTEEGQVQAYWKGEPAPAGVIVSYREAGAEGEAWRTWGETPDLVPPGSIGQGYHAFEFIALYGEVESPVEMMQIYIGDDMVAEEEEAETAPAGSGSAAAAEDEPEPQPEQSSGSFIRHDITVLKDGEEDPTYEHPGIRSITPPSQRSNSWWDD